MDIIFRMNNPARILVCEDEAPIAKAFSLKLTAAGFDVEIAPDGQVALDQLQNGNFDLLILDMVMPNVDGIGVLTAMKERALTTPVIVATNLSQTEDVNRTAQVYDSVKDYFVKSETPIAEMVERVKKVLGL